VKLRILSFVAALLVLAGCATSPRGVRWYAPTTWSLFSGAHKIDAAAKAEAKVEAAKADLALDEREAVHAAHIEIRKGQLSAATLPESPAATYTQRTLGNGLGLLGQVDPLTAAEESSSAALVRDILSADAARVATAERKQQAAERTALDLSAALTAANERLAALETRASKAESAERAAHEQNLALANELRAQSWRFWIAVVLVVLFAAAALYAKLALGGVGAALHAAGAPAAVITALDSQLSKLGQLAIRTGRVAAAKAEAALAAKSS